MGIFLVTYDVSGRTKLSRPDFPAILNKHYDWNIELAPGAYAVDTQDSADQILAHFTPHMLRGDRIYVISLALPMASKGPNTDRMWLEKSLPSLLSQKD